MKIMIHEYGQHITAVTPQGKIDALGVSDLHRQFQRLLDEGTINFIIDLSSTPFVDSSGLATLLSMYRVARQADGDVKSIQPRERTAQHILELARFDRVFDIVQTIEDALERF